MPEWVSVHASNSGSRTSSYTACVGYSLPSASLTITVSNTPPARASTVMRSRGADTPAGPQKCVRWSASIMQRKTSSRGASKTRLKRSWLGAPSSTPCSPMPPCRSPTFGSFPFPPLVLQCLALGRCCRSASSASSLSKRSPQRRRCVAIQSSAPSSASGSRWQGRNWASCHREIRPLRSSTLRCLEIPGSDMSKGAASSPTVASPRARRLRMARRVGSASAVKAASSRSSVVVVTVLHLTSELVSCQVKYRRALPCYPSSRRAPRPAPEERRRPCWYRSSRAPPARVGSASGWRTG